MAALGGSARADDVDDLVAQGEELAKASEFSRAIAAFKAADAKRPQAKLSCLIALAYTRRELWPQAELFLAQCQTRATADDPLPDWFEQAQATLADKLLAIHAAEITITVTPATARVTVSSFESDEVFAPRAIHLARGRYTIEASATGYVTASRDVVVDSDRPQTVEIALKTPAELAPPPPPPPEPEPPRAPLYVIAAGGVVGLGGLAYHLLVFKPAYDRLASAPNVFAYADDRPDFRTKRDVTIGIYSAAAVTIAIGAILHWKLQPAAVVTAHGVALSLEWAR